MYRTQATGVGRSEDAVRSERRVLRLLAAWRGNDGRPTGEDLDPPRSSTSSTMVEHHRGRTRRHMRPAPERRPRGDRDSTLLGWWATRSDIRNPSKELRADPSLMSILFTIQESLRFQIRRSDVRAMRVLEPFELLHGVFDPEVALSSDCCSIPPNSRPGRLRRILDELRLHRKPNPHLTFGAGTTLAGGAARPDGTARSVPHVAGAIPDMGAGREAQVQAELDIIRGLQRASVSPRWLEAGSRKRGGDRDGARDTSRGRQRFPKCTTRRPSRTVEGLGDLGLLIRRVRVRRLSVYETGAHAPRSRVRPPSPRWWRPDARRRSPSTSAPR